MYSWEYNRDRSSYVLDRTYSVFWVKTKVEYSINARDIRIYQGFLNVFFVVLIWRGGINVVIVTLQIDGEWWWGFIATGGPHGESPYYCEKNTHQMTQHWYKVYWLVVHFLLLCSDVWGPSCTENNHTGVFYFPLFFSPLFSLFHGSEIYMFSFLN